MFGSGENTFGRSHVAAQPFSPDNQVKGFIKAKTVNEVGGLHLIPAH